MELRASIPVKIIKVNRWTGAVTLQVQGDENVSDPVTVHAGDTAMVDYTVRQKK
jgi:hypothetical protein